MWRRPRSTRDFASEVESHLTIETDRLMASGMSEEEARHAARRSFGNVTSHVERFHASRPSAWLEAVLRNVRYALRGLSRRPAFAITAVITLAFGIGVNSALFTLFYSLVLRPPPVGNPAQHVNVFRDVGDDGRNYMLVVNGHGSMLSWPDYVRLRDGTQTLAQIAVFRRQPLRLDLHDQSLPIEAQLVSCNYFAATNMSVQLGRPFVNEECATKGEGRVAVLSHSYWVRQFGADRSIIGRSVTINAQLVTIIGVAPRGFEGIAIDPVDVWLPVTMYPALLPGNARDFDRDISWLTAFGTLRPGVSTNKVQAELTMLARREDSNWPGRVTTMQVMHGSALLNPEARTNVMIASTAAMMIGVLILAMCCANVMNLLLARAATRQREIGIRLALGATRARLLAQLMIESSVLAIAGGATGLVLAWLLPPLIRLAAPDQQLNLVLKPDGWVLLATMSVALVSTLVFGLLPALQSTRLQLTAAIRSESSAQLGSGRAARWRAAAVVTQVSVSALLLVIAAMFLRATQHSFSVAPGFVIDGISAVRTDFGPASGDSLHQLQFYSALRREVAQLPAVHGVAESFMVPLRGRASTTVVVTGRDGAPSNVPTLLNEVSGNYFTTLGIVMKSGQPFTDRESDAVPAIVSEAFARQAWPGRSALGQTIKQEDRQLVVTGVVSDVQSVSLGIADGPYLYTPVSHSTQGEHQLIVRADAPPAVLQSMVARISRELDPNVVVTVRGMNQELERLVAPVRLTGQVASGLGLTALLLAMIGVYGVVTFTVTQRSREIGIRMALGATQQNVRGLVFRQGTRVVVTGLAIGILAAIALSQAIRSVLFGLSAVDGIALTSVTLALSGVAALAIAIPALRASRVDPMTSLRAE